MATRQVLITGAGGFIGSHLVERTLQRGDAVRAFVHYNSLGTAGWLDRSPSRADVEVIHGDVRDLARRIGRFMGAEVSFEFDPARARRPESEVERLRCDSRRLRTLTGWTPAFTLDAGLEATIAWLRENLAADRPEAYAI